MAAEIALRPARSDDVTALLPRLRRADARELLLASGAPPRDAITRSLEASTVAWAGVVDGRVECLFGCGPASLLGGIGVPWLVASHDLPRHATAFLRRNRPVLGLMRARYPVLRNWVHADNALSLAWLGWLGFRIHPTEPHGPFGAPFHPFSMER